MHYVASACCYANLMSKTRPIELVTFPATVKWSPLHSSEISPINRDFAGPTSVTNESFVKVDLKNAVRPNEIEQIDNITLQK